MTSLSEVAKLRQSIQQEIEASRRGLHDFASVAQHASQLYHEKSTLMQIRRDHGLQSSELANVAGVPLRIEYQAEIGALIDRNEAEKILHALSSLTGTRYSLENVSIEVKSGVML
jgi:hypothetical protein